MDKKIFKLDQEVVQEVRAFEMTNLSPGASETFRTPTLNGKRPVRTNRPAAELERKDRRFQVDPVLRDLISNDAETDLEIETRVREAIDSQRATAESEGREEGYAAGYEKGKAEAKSNFESTAREKIEKLDALLAGFEGLKDDVYRANERFLVELVYRISGSILQREIVIDSEYLSRVVRSVVEKVGVKEQLKLIASASQVETLYGILPELEKKHSSLKNVSVEASSQLSDMDVVIETDWNRIDATLDSQLGSLHEVVLTALEESQNPMVNADSGESESA